jgi:hypothetical protein
MNVWRAKLSRTTDANWGLGGGVGVLGAFIGGPSRARSSTLWPRPFGSPRSSRESRLELDQHRVDGGEDPLHVGVADHVRRKKVDHVAERPQEQIALQETSVKPRPQLAQVSRRAARAELDRCDRADSANAGDGRAFRERREVPGEAPLERTDALEAALLVEDPQALERAPRRRAGWPVNECP